MKGTGVSSVFKTVILALALGSADICLAQCNQNIEPPAPVFFNTGKNGSGGSLQAPANDPNWMVAKDSINAVYAPAVVMAALPNNYHEAIPADAAWVSFSTLGEHTGNKFFFFRLLFELPCSNHCGVSYNAGNNYCLSLDLYTDNSVYEIYVNGIPQSNSLGNMPLSNPFNPVAHTPNDRTTVVLCKDWKAGANSIIIQVASSATVAALMVQASARAVPPISSTITDSICKGRTYFFGNKALTESGLYLDTFYTTSGCDSIVALHLTVKENSSSTLSATICTGQNFLGYSASGNYADTLTAVNGCDSIRTIHLTVSDRPHPNLGTGLNVCADDSLILSPGEFLSYLWQDSSSANYYVVRKPGRYSVTVTNICGSGSVEVLVNNNNCGIFFPTAFTPDGDGKNDLFKIISAHHFQLFRLTVFNRWGNATFDSNDPAKGWDGKFRGRAVSSGIYVWYCRFEISGRFSEMKGTVALIR